MLEMLGLLVVVVEVGGWLLLFSPGDGHTKTAWWVGEGGWVRRGGGRERERRRD